MSENIKTRKTRKIFIMTTSDCNLKCRYCYESNKSRQDMNADTIKTILRSEFDGRKESFSDFLITFHGGEPFMVFDKMRNLSEWIWENFSELNINLTTTTNGTILTPQIKEWLTLNRHRFFVTLSIDGDKETHNMNRDSSFDRIDKDFFALNHGRGWAKMTICPNSITDMFHNFEYLYNTGFSPNATLACETDWNREKDFPILKKELSKLINFYLTHPDLRPGEILSIPIDRFSDDAYIPKNRCGIGENSVAYDVNGNKYPCQNFIADVSKKYDFQSINKTFNIIESNDYKTVCKECCDCNIKEACTPCYGLNLSNRAGMGNVDEVWCEITRILIYATAQLTAKALLHKDNYGWLKDKSDNEIRRLIEGVKRVKSINSNSSQA